MKIYSDDGREFKSINECNAYETNQKLKLQKEQEEHAKAVAKAEEERKSRVEKLDEINTMLHKVSELIDTYEKTTDRKVIYTYDYAARNFMVTDTKNSIDFAWDVVPDELFKAIRKFSHTR